MILNDWFQVSNPPKLKETSPLVNHLLAMVRQGHHS
jgi:hypothetical protein